MSKVLWISNIWAGGFLFGTLNGLYAEKLGGFWLFCVALLSIAVGIGIAQLVIHWER